MITFLWTCLFPLTFWASLLRPGNCIEENDT